MTDEEKDLKEAMDWLSALDINSEWEASNKEILLSTIEKQESIIKNASYIIKKTNKQFKDFDDIKLNEYLYNFDKCATIKEE